jgi:hypothetical protein
MQGGARETTMTEHAGTVSADHVRPLDSAFMMRVFYAFAALALLSVVISVGGKWLGRSMVMAGHSDDATLFEVVIGNNVVAAPGNMIRFPRSRRNGIADRLDLYFRWPDLKGYSAASKPDFNHAGGARRIIFATIEPRIMSRDMSGRFEPIYRDLILMPGKAGPSGTIFYAFGEKSGYMNEMLVVGDRGKDEPFVARCLTGPAAEESLAPCERDIHIGDELSLTYRFPAELLPEWEKVDARVVATIDRMVKSGRR